MKESTFCQFGNMKREILFFAIHHRHPSKQSKNWSEECLKSVKTSKPQAVRWNKTVSIKKFFFFPSKIEGYWDARAWSVRNKNNTPNVEACIINLLPKMKFFSYLSASIFGGIFWAWMSLLNPKIKLVLFTGKVRASIFIFQTLYSKLNFFKLQILSSKFNLRPCFVRLSNFN